MNSQNRILSKVLKLSLFFFISQITEASQNISSALSQAKITCSGNLVENFDVDNLVTPVAT